MIQAQTAFTMELFKPDGKYKNYVQACWSACAGKQSEQRWLQGDGCSGLIFILSGRVSLDGSPFSTGVIFLPTGDKAHTIELSQGAQITGIRFCPGITKGIFNRTVKAPVQLNKGVITPDPYQLVESMKSSMNHQSRLVQMYRWIEANLECYNVLPPVFSTAVQLIEKDHMDLWAIQEQLPICQRQLERQFKQFLGLTPKQYQRIIRVKRTLEKMKQLPNSDLAKIALQSGFSDQAHMTRELKTIAKITPRKFASLIK